METSDDLKPGFLMLKLETGLLHEYSDGNFTTSVFGFTDGGKLELPQGYTHLGTVVEGEIELSYLDRKRILKEGDFFSVVGSAKINSRGLGMVSSAKGYSGFNICGGPFEKEGKLRYIDGCTDTLLVPPVRKGDPCLNHLHFPKNITQTQHTHPSVRTGIVYRGKGECVVSEGNIPLVTGYAFIIKTNTPHSFNTLDETMDVIAFHPDSDTGMTDDDHPIVNRTMVDGVSARYIDEIRTKKTNK